MLTGSIPVLHVASTVAAEAFYTRMGFRVEFTDASGDRRTDPRYMGLSWGDALLHLSSHAGDGVAGGVAYFHVHDVDALHAGFEERGVPVHLRPVDQTWGMRECYVRDPDGNSLRFGCPAGGKGECR